MTLDKFTHGVRWWEPLGRGGVYMRHSTRVHPITLRRLQCIDVANVELPEETRGNGVFTAFLTDLEGQVRRNIDFDAVWAENVLNEALAAFFLRRGYMPVPGDGPPCFLWGPLL